MLVVLVHEVRSGKVSLCIEFEHRQARRGAVCHCLSAAPRTLYFPVWHSRCPATRAAASEKYITTLVTFRLMLRYLGWLCARTTTSAKSRRDQYAIRIHNRPPRPAPSEPAGAGA